MIIKTQNLSRLLKQFQERNQSVFVEKSNWQDTYFRDGITHYWNEHLIWKVASFKNSIIQFAKGLPLVKTGGWPLALN